jgi:DNA-binding transcriptional ArsR family regulator
MLEALFRSRVVVKLIDYFIQDPSKECYLREVSREVNEPASAVQRELQKLEEFGLVVTRRRGNHRYFAINEDFPFLTEMKSMFIKSEGVVRYLKESISDMDGVQLAFIYGEFAKKPSMTAEIKIMIIGNAKSEKIERIKNSAQAMLKRNIVFSSYQPENFSALFEKQDPVLGEMLGGEKIVLVANMTDRATV